MRASSAAACVLLLVATLPVSGAHVPSVDASERSIDASRSWAFYESLAAGQVDTWTFASAKGDTIFLTIGVPAGSAWSPEASLEGPSGPVPLVRADEVSFEPFTPYAARDVWTLEAPAPADGTYTLRVTGGGSYVLGFGLRESWTPIEWATIPLAALQVHRWEGQPWLLLAAPYALALVGVVLLARVPRARAPGALALVAAGLLAGTALERVAQLGLGLAEGARPAAWALVVALVIPALSAGLALAAWRARRAWTLAAIGVGAAAAWSGLLLGPALLLGAAVETARRKRHLAIRGPPAT